MPDFVRTIRFKLTVWFVSILAIVILAISAVLYVGVQRVLLQSVDTNLRTAGVRSVAPANADQVPFGQLFPDSEQSEQLRRLVLLSNTPARLLALDGALLQSDPLFPRGISITVDALTTANAGAARFETIQVGLSTYRLYTAPVKVNNIRTAIVQVVDSMDEQVKTLEGLRSLLVWLIPLSLILAGIGGSFLAGRALAPMTRVRRDVEKIIDQSDLSHRVSTGLPDDEVGRLARTFDQLLERVQQAMDRERRFTSDASHELRSPLTVLKGEISVALSRARLGEDYRRTLAQLEPTVDDMIRLVEDLLTLTRASANKQVMSTEPLNIVDLVMTICARMQVVARDKGIALECQSDRPVLVIMGDRIRLQRVFTNLIDNALHYTPRDGKVDVAIHNEGFSVHIDVRDTGRGIASEHLPRLFQRLYRADADRARDSGGSGLGLAIAQTIARSHGGRISVESKLGHGSTFKVALPLAPTQTIPLPDTGAGSEQPVSHFGGDLPLGAPPTSYGELKRDEVKDAKKIKVINPMPVTVHPQKSLELHDRTFRAMNTDVSIFLLSADARHANCVLDAAEWFFVQMEWRLSRFRDSSEISTLNRTGSGRASRVLFEILQLAARSYEETSGVFNPLIGPALIAAGYNRTFDDIGTDAMQPGLGDSAKLSAIPGFVDNVILDPLTRQVTLRNKVQLDLGGIAKGWAIDRTFRTLSKMGPCCINAGGDVHVGGSFEPDGDGWRIDIADPFALDLDTVKGMRAVMLKDRAIATSGVMKRRWLVNGTEQHHLIDPRTAQPARNNLLFVTAIGDTTIQAEVAAKTVFIMGEEEGSAWADARQIPVLLMFRDGEYLCNEYFPGTV